MSAADEVVLDGESLSAAALARIARHPRVRVEIAPGVLTRVAAGWREIEQLVEGYTRDFEALQDGKDVQPAFEYGVTTGFGEFKDIPVAPEDLEALQRNILLSHSTGVGRNADAGDTASYFPAEVVRAAMAIRLNAFLKGFSGVRVQLVEVLRAMLNKGIVPLVLQRGSVGSSGDLCPLAHLFAVLLGEGRFWRVESADDLRRQPCELHSASLLSEALGIAVPQPSYKEGLALTNGATFSTALLALAVHDGAALAKAADVATALTFEAMCGCARALDPRVHAARGHRGQIDSAENLRALLAESRQMERGRAVQDPYSLRCAPQVHGAARDVLAYARMVVETELNAATDNPLFFPGDQPEHWDAQFSGNAGYNLQHRIAYSAGNFHGEPVGIAADALAIGLAELADIAERRIQMLLDSDHNRNLPGNLIALGGLNSGFMIAQYTAAALVSENKVLAHPASVDSIPTSANSEDHNAMATIAARKLRSVLHNVQAVLAIELMVAAQAIDWRVGMNREPRLKGEGGGEQQQPVAGASSPAQHGIDARWAKLLGRTAELKEESVTFERETGGPERRAAIAAQLGRGTNRAYLRIRELVTPLIKDRPLDEDIRRLRETIEDGSFVLGLEHELAAPLRDVRPLAVRRG